MDCIVVRLYHPKRELEFKITISAGLQDINSFYITQENPKYCLHFIRLKLKNYAGSILLTLALEIININISIADKSRIEATLFFNNKHMK